MIKQSMLKRCLPFPRHSEGAKRVKNLCLNGNTIKAPHLYYGSYYAGNFFKNSSKFFQNRETFFEKFHLLYEEKIMKEEKFTEIQMKNKGRLCS